MIKKINLLLATLLLSIAVYAQPGPVIVPSYVKLLPDSVESRQLISALNGFLQQSTKPTKENTFALPACLPETASLVAEIKGQENGKGPDKVNFYKCYLTNLMPLDSNNYIVQLAYMGMDGSAPVVRISFKLMAQKMSGQFYFYSPLQRNTLNWKSKTYGSFTFYYQISLDNTRAANYARKAAEFDAKLHAPQYINHLYFAGDLQEALALLGIDYKMDYNGFRNGDFSAFDNDIDLDVMASDDKDAYAYDLHDLWHDRLHKTISVTIINKPVDEACAYLYGGSWNIPWPVIFKRFKAFMGDNKDWLTAFTDNKNFGESQANHLYVAYVINALLVQKIEKEKGFPGVIELLSCGKHEDSNDKYFIALNKIIGINRANFNVEVGKLVEGESVE